jgi:hypothetical protein
MVLVCVERAKFIRIANRFLSPDLWGRLHALAPNCSVAVYIGFMLVRVRCRLVQCDRAKTDCFLTDLTGDLEALIIHSALSKSNVA